MQATFKPLGDAAVRIGLGEELSPRVHRRVCAVHAAIAKAQPRGVVELVPSYTALTVYYRPHEVRYARLKADLAKWTEQAREQDLPPAEVVEIPVCYGGAFGPDLHEVAALTGLKAPDLIERHTRPAYLMYMMGFAPGFPLLGGLDEGLFVPRLDVPRRSVPAGSVGIAGRQTGIYSLETPGGWRILGRTPLKLFEPLRDPPVLLQAGDYLRFVAVTDGAYRRIEEEVARGSFRMSRRPLGS